MIFKRKWIYFLSGIIVIFACIAISLPHILRSLGLHPSYDGQEYRLNGSKALIVTTSHGILNKPGELDGKPTGVFGSELTVPYYEFLDAEIRVDLASIEGGEIPVDPISFIYFIKEDADKRSLKDEIFQAKVRNSVSVRDVDFKEYDIIFFAGGWGAAYDMAQSEILAMKVSEAYYNSDVIFGSVCHGVLAFTQAKDSIGDHLIEGRTMTGVTQKQLEELGITYTPRHPEIELKKAGAIYKANHKTIDIFATLTVIDEEKRFITGQNQNSGRETCQVILKILEEMQH